MVDVHDAKLIWFRMMLLQVAWGKFAQQIRSSQDKVHVPIATQVPHLFYQDKFHAESYLANHIPEELEQAVYADQIHAAGYNILFVWLLAIWYKVLVQGASLIKYLLLTERLAIEDNAQTSTSIWLKMADVLHADHHKL